MSTFRDDAPDEPRWASSDDTHWVSSEDNGWDHPAEGTRPLGAEDTHPLLTDDTTSGGATHATTSGETADAAISEPATTLPPPPRALPRPSGPSWSTIAFGLVCLVVAGGALLVEFSELTLDWDRTGPLALVGVGVLLVLVGLTALVRRGDSEEELDH